MPLLEGKTYCQFAPDGCPRPYSYTEKDRLFFAYPSSPETSADAMHKAIELINERGLEDIQVTDWQELQVEGNIIFCEICEAIQHANCVVLNCTNANFNVMFEYGFAIGKDKRIYPLLEESVVDSRFYSKFETLTNIGYAKFKKGDDLFKKLGKKRPWRRKPRFALPETLGSEPARGMNNMLYLKATHDNEPSSRITETLVALPVTLLVDDPSEVSFPPLSWYLYNIGRSFSVIINLGSQRVEDYKLHWVKCALVAGIAVSLGRRVLIVGEDIQLKPIDYMELIKSYKNARQAEQLVHDFASPIADSMAQFREYVRLDLKSKPITDIGILPRLSLGEFVAENELESLDNYFVETPQFLSAMQPTYKISVGRKGTGKTANFQTIVSRLQKSRHTVVCEIKPAEWELNQLLQFVKGKFIDPQKSYVLQTLWKVMLYSEAVKACYSQITKKLPSVQFSSAEEALRVYVDDRKDLFELSFTSRLVKLARESRAVGGTSDIPEYSLSETLHQSIISDMQRILCDYIGSELDRFAVTIDNLDANWKTGRRHYNKADILLALLNATRDVWRTCKSYLYKIEKNKDVSMLIFLRSDAFKVLLERARDPDKLEYEFVYWDSVDLLLEVIMRRLAYSLGNGDTGDANLSNLLESGFQPDDLKTFLTNNILSRPRDYIVLFQHVLYQAQSKGQRYFRRNDFYNAMGDYSEYALTALSAESQPFIPSMHNLLSEFIESKPLLTLYEVNELLQKGGISRNNQRTALDFLIESNFLGYGIDEFNYSFPNTPVAMTTTLKRVQRHAQRGNDPRVFKIHNAFHNSLGVHKT